jgi:hypothetical protein
MRGDNRSKRRRRSAIELRPKKYERVTRSKSQPVICCCAR